jgi:TonB-linked SusC/RagA family outer membrane protein
MKIILCFLIFLLSRNSAEAQKELIITGTVISAKDQKPLWGVTLTVKGTLISTTSGEHGTFSLKVQKNQVITISHVGYEKKELNADSISSPVTIILSESAITMNDVVVSTGYQQMKKANTTGSYEKINSELFNRSTGTSILSRLDGIAGSVFFDKRQGSDAPIQLRGISSLGFASTSPLIILDNFPYEGDLNNINPNDVESVTILKDAAASSIWGAKAGNGVIVVTTKKGQFNQPVKLSLNENIIITQKPDLFTEKNLTTSDYIDMEQMLFNKGFYDYSLSNTYNYPPVSPIVQILAKEQSGTITQTDANNQINLLRNSDVLNDFEKYLYRPGLTQQYNLNLSGGSKNFKYLLSGGYNRNNATLVGNRNAQFTFRSDNTFIPAKNLQLDVAVGYTQNNLTNNSPGGYHDISIFANGSALYPYTRLADDLGNPLPVDVFYSGNFTDTAGAGILLNWKYTPLNELKNVSRTTGTNALIADVGLRYSFSKALNAEIKYQYQNTQGNLSTIYNANSFQASNLINEFTQYDGSNVTYIVPYGSILDAGQNNLQGYGLRGQINFNEIINKKNLINVIGGAEIRQTGTTSNNYRTYGYDDKLNFTNVDYVNAYPTFDNIAGNATIPSANGFSSMLERYVSIYANANYTFNKLYTFSGSFRKDASNLFGVKANQKGIPLWSAGAGWNISSENFYNLKWLPFLKLRATFGYGGNVSHTVSALTTIHYNPAAWQPIINVPYNYIQNYPNPDLQWEKVGMANIGFDFGSANSRITGSIEYFQKNATDLIGSKSIDPTLGTFNIFTNSANLRGHGFDIVINSANIVTRNFRWETNFLFSSLKNKIVKYLDKDAYTIGYTSDGQYINPIQGYEPYLIVSYKWAGLDSAGNPLGYVNGKESNDYYAIRNTPLAQQATGGSAIPHFFGSLRNTFSWKQLGLSFNITYKLSYFFRRPSLNDYNLFYYGKGNVEYSNRWQKPGDEKITNVPALLYPVDNDRETFYQYADINVEKGDQVRLNDARISYQLSSPALAELSLQRFQVFAYLSNLNILLWKANKAGLDPDFPTGLKTPISASFGITTNF